MGSQSEFVLAHYKYWKAWRNIVLLVLLIASVPFLTFLLAKKISAGWRFHAYADLCCIISWVSIIHVARAVYSMVCQIMFHNGRLVWIENGLLIWRDPKFYSVRCSNIKNIVGGFGGDFGQFETLVLKMRDGSEKTITTGLFREDLEVIVARLKSMIGLS